MKNNFLLITLLFLIAFSLLGKNINSQIISHDNKFYVSLTEAQNQKLQEIFRKENLNNFPIKVINEDTFLINEIDLNISSLCKEENEKFLQNSINSCNKYFIKKSFKQKRTKNCRRKNCRRKFEKRRKHNQRKILYVYRN